ncbi:20022_t:CDS:2, partial [Racocetra fulgida]
NVSSHFHNQPNTNQTHESNESNSEDASNNSKLEVTTVSRGNRRGQGWLRLTRTNQSANNSHSNCSNHSKHGKHSTGGSKGHYGSGYGQPRIIFDYSNSWDAVKDQVIVNCWRKTGILSSVSCEEIEVATNNPDPEIRSQLNTYLDLKIIEIVLDEANQHKNGDPDDLDDEQSENPISEGLMGLNKFISFFEQQIDTDFVAEDLIIF